MGMFDAFVGNCPKCNAEFSVQTKLTDCVLEEIRCGDRADLGGVSGGRWLVRLALRNPCPGCDGVLVAVIQNRILNRYEVNTPFDVKEDAGGHVALPGDVHAPSEAAPLEDVMRLTPTELREIVKTADQVHDRPSASVSEMALADCVKALALHCLAQEEERTDMES